MTRNFNKNNLHSTLLRANIASAKKKKKKKLEKSYWEEHFECMLQLHLANNNALPNVLIINSKVPFGFSVNRYY